MIIAFGVNYAVDIRERSKIYLIGLSKIEMAFDTTAITALRKSKNSLAF